MAELMLASAAVKELVSIVVSHGRQEVGLLWNFKKDLEEMQITLATIEAVLEDAEKRSIDDKAVGLWMSELKKVCFDIEDMMDVFMLKSKGKPQVQDDMLVKVRKIIHYPSSFLAREIFAHRMKTMRGRLDKVAQRKDQFNLKVGSGLYLQEVITKRETSSVYASQYDSEFVGREKEKNTIVNLILEKKNQYKVPFVVPIVGFGGLGKTTLAKLVFNDERMRNLQNFEIFSWAYVSVQFDVLNIATRLANSFTGENVSYTSLQTVSTRLKELVAGKRYLIVLDDVWTENMNDINKLYEILSWGSQGSTIILTTRQKEIAERVAKIDPYNLEPLSEDACLTLFQQRAFKSPEELDEYPNLVEIGKKIVGRCKGVALTVVSFGSILRSKKEEDFWWFIEKSENWELHANNILAQSSSTNGQDSESRILSSLWLSYYFMPPPLKSCFNYCSIFKKGDKIKKISLFEQWISLGFIHSPANLTLHGVAQQYLNSFLSMSFMLPYEVNQFSDVEGEYVTMHDLVHDLAQLTARADNVAHRYISIHEDEWLPATEAHDGILAKKPSALHLFGSDTMKLCTKKSFPQHRCLRVLQLEDCDSQQLLRSVDKLKQMRYLSLRKLSVFPNITGLPFLRYLDLSYSNVVHIPDVIGKLQSLCYLNLSSCPIETLPETICNLHNLQYLYVCSTLVTTLPTALGHLYNLSHLSVSNKLKEIPGSIGNLKNLQVLNFSYCDDLVTLPESIGNLKRLVQLNLSYCSNLERLPETVINLENLQMLDLSHCYDLVTLPESIINLGTLVYLDLSYCSKMERLPEYSYNVQKLQQLDLSHCNSLVSLPQSMDKLRFLERLDLSNCNGLVILPESIVLLEKLVHLNLSDCPNLREVPVNFGSLTSLQNLNMANCSSLKYLPQSFTNLVNLEELVLTGCSNIPNLPLSWESMNCLRHLFLDGCNLRPFLTIASGITQLKNLQTLTLPEYKVSEVDQEDGSPSDCSPALLRDMDMLTGTLRITGLENLSDWRDLAEAKLEKKKKLDTLELVWYSVDTYYSWSDSDVVGLPSSLLYLEIWGFAGREWPTFRLPEDHCLTTIKLCNIRRCWRFPDSLLYLGRLEHLHLETRRGILYYSFDEEAFSSLKTLVLVDDVACDILWGQSIGTQHFKQHFPSLTSLDISSCSELRRLPEWLGEVSTLKYIRINDCNFINRLPDSWTRLPQLVTLYIGACDRRFLERYGDESRGRRKIAHIPHLRITADSIPREEFLATQRPMQN